MRWCTSCRPGSCQQTRGKPRYRQRQFDAAEKRVRRHLIISPDGHDDSLRMQQDASVYAGLINGEESATVTLSTNRHAYVHVVRGSVELSGGILHAGDGLRLCHPKQLAFNTEDDAEVLVFDLRPNELPQML